MMKYTLFLCVFLFTTCTVFGFYPQCAQINRQCSNMRRCCSGLVCRNSGYGRVCQRGGIGNCISYGQMCQPYGQGRQCCNNRRCRQDFGSPYAKCM